MRLPLQLIAMACGVLPSPCHAQDIAPLTDEQLITSAEQGAPISISRLAQVIIWKANGMKTLREGTNGWWCMPDDPISPAPDPLCGDANALEWLTALKERKMPPRGELGVLYAQQGAQIASNIDPFATSPPPGQDWIDVPPHIGTVNDPMHYLGMVGSPDPDVTIPFVVWFDTPYAHMRQPLDLQ